MPPEDSIKYLNLDGNGLEDAFALQLLFSSTAKYGGTKGSGFLMPLK